MCIRDSNNNVHIYGLLQLGNIANVETVLTGLSSTYATISSLSSYLTTATATSTYATISSLSAYVKTSLANTFSALQTFSSGISITGGITLPSSTMTAPTSNQIGCLTKNTYGSSTIAYQQQNLGSITLSPANW